MLTEPIAALDQASYQVRSYPRNAPGDLDQDGIDDLTELAGFPELGPLNPVLPIPYVDGVACIHTRESYIDLAFQPGEADENPRLQDLEFVKFYILDNDEADSNRVYFMNTVNHEAHVNFARAVGIPTQATGNSFFEDMRGLLVYYPEVTAPSGHPTRSPFRKRSCSTTPVPVGVKKVVVR
ncbi:MAG: hypothetical protein ACI81P_003502 [Neolewinella sp.]